MKERGFYMDTAEVQATLAGNKTQARVLVNVCSEYPPVADQCPYGQVGDRLWVEEKFYELGKWTTQPLGESGEYEAVWNSKDLFGGPYHYMADKIRPEPITGYEWRKKSPATMKRKAARLLLEITAIRIQRLYDMTEEEARAEGVKMSESGQKYLNYEYRASKSTQFIYCETTALGSFASWWNLRYGYGTKHRMPLRDNPWVWVIEFKKIEG